MLPFSGSREITGLSLLILAPHKKSMDFLLSVDLRSCRRVMRLPSSSRATMKTRARPGSRSAGFGTLTLICVIFVSRNLGMSKFVENELCRARSRLHRIRCFASKYLFYPLFSLFYLLVLYLMLLFQDTSHFRSWPSRAGASGPSGPSANARAARRARPQPPCAELRF